MKQVFTSGLSDARIRSTFRAARFGSRTRCPECGYTRKLWKLSDDRWRCGRCRHRFSLTSGTWLAQVRLDPAQILELLYWFELELTDHGIAQRLEAPYHRVHRFFLLLREAIHAYEEQSIRRLGGEVEVDESYFGPRFRNRRKATRQKLRKEGKVKRGRAANLLQTVVMGIYERADGIVYVEPVPDTGGETLQGVIRQKVSIETTIYSDSLSSYNGLDRTFADHQVLSHQAQEYVRGSATINGIEGFWAYAKERILRHHGVSADHFLFYIKEMEYRFNHRTLSQEEFVEHLLQVLLSPKLVHET